MCRRVGGARWGWDPIARAAIASAPAELRLPRRCRSTPTRIEEVVRRALAGRLRRRVAVPVGTCCDPGFRTSDAAHSAVGTPVALRTQRDGRRRDASVTAGEEANMVLVTTLLGWFLLQSY